MASRFTVVYDACVLYPAALRDLLMQLALTDLFRARWTNEIHDEWIRNLRENRPDLTIEQLTRTKELMNSNRDCLVDSYKWLILSLELPDPGDCHVLAAAIKTNADVIVTFNQKDFPASALGKYEIEAQHSDDFISYLLDLQPAQVATAAEICRKRLKNPPKSIDEYLDILLRQQLTITVDVLRELIYEI